MSAEPSHHGRTPAQIEAARRNGAESRGPRTEEGKARSRLNALKHGLAAAGHLLLEGEGPAAWEELLTDLVAEHAPGTETEARLVHRLAAALWRQDRADRLERACFAAAPRPRYITPNGYEHASPEGTFDLGRCNAIRLYAGQAAREVSRCLRELRSSRAERPGARVEEEVPGNEPGDQPAATNGNALAESGPPTAAPVASGSTGNEPGRAPATPRATPSRPVFRRGATERRFDAPRAARPQLRDSA